MKNFTDFITEQTFRKNDKVQITNKADDFFGEKGVVRTIGKGKQKGFLTVDLEKSGVVSYEAGELKLLRMISLPPGSRRKP